MDIRQMVIQDYRERLAMRSDLPAELKRALKAHERVPLFVDNLTAQIKAIPEARRRKGVTKGFKMDRMKLKNLVYDMTDVFIQNVKRLADEKALSDIEVSRLNQDPLDGLGKALDNQGNGSIKDLGVEIKDDKDRSPA